MTCPACERGELNERGICQKCGVAIPCGVDILKPTAGRRRMGHGPSNEQASAYTDYIRKKEEDASDL